MKYAVYIITVEDTEENDQRIADLYPEAMERAAGNISAEAAAEAAKYATMEASAYDLGIAK
jgi:hypothetical protein